jgi:hypothetical protein
VTNWLLDKLIDHMPAASLGSMVLSREAIKPLIADKLPDKHLIEKFERAYNDFKSRQFTTQPGYRYVDIIDGRAVILKDALEEACRDMVVYAESTEDLDLLTDLQKYIDHTNELNEKLAALGRVRIIFSEDSLVFKPKGEGIRVNKKKLSSIIG